MTTKANSNTTTVTQLRAGLLEVFDGLRNGSLEAKDVIEINNTAGKIISSAKVELAHYALRGETPNIPFLMAGGDTLSIEQVE